MMKHRTANYLVNIFHWNETKRKNIALTVLLCQCVGFSLHILKSTVGSLWFCCRRYILQTTNLSENSKSIKSKLQTLNNAKYSNGIHLMCVWLAHSIHPYKNHSPFDANSIVEEEKKKKQNSMPNAATADTGSVQAS